MCIYIYIDIKERERYIIYMQGCKKYDVIAKYPINSKYISKVNEMKLSEAKHSKKIRRPKGLNSGLKKHKLWANL